MSLRVSQSKPACTTKKNTHTTLKLKQLNFMIYTCVSYCENVKIKALLFVAKPATLNRWNLCVQFIFLSSYQILKYQKIGQAEFPLPPLSWQITKLCLTADTLAVWLLCWVSASVSSWSISSPAVLKIRPNSRFFSLLLLSNRGYTDLILAHKLTRHQPEKLHINICSIHSKGCFLGKKNDSWMWTRTKMGWKKIRFPNVSLVLYSRVTAERPICW